MKTCKNGGIGRHAGLRGLWRNPCGFESHFLHQIDAYSNFLFESNKYKLEYYLVFCYIGMKVKYKTEKLGISQKKRLEGINDGKKSYDTQNEIIRRTI